MLALSNKCHLCSENAQLYRRLSLERNPQSHIGTLALFQESLSDAEQYLKELNVSVDEVKQAPLILLGFKGTPTLLIVDNSGQVTHIWVGKLAAAQEDQVLGQFRRERVDNVLTVDAAVPEPELNNEEFERMVKSGRKVTVVDVRQRTEYQLGHVDGAKNIPVDEIAVRAPNELSDSDFILISCQCPDKGLTSLARQLLVKGGFKSVAVLR